ncbi:MAG: C-terminal binding protein [Anaerolineae bacterium]
MNRLALVTDADFPSLVQEEAILAAAGIRLRPPPGPTEADLLAAVREADAFLVQQRPITRKVLEAAPRLKVIACYGVGYDSVDVAAAAERRIYVCNVPDYCTDEVATHALAMLLALARKLSLADRLVRAGDWTNFKALKPMQGLTGQRLGLVGFGRIGQALAHMAAGLKMEVWAYDPLIPAARFEELGVKQVDLDTLLVSCHYISLHLPLTPTTERLISRQRLALLRPDACLINCARGRLIDEPALIEALAAGRLAGAALDVFWDEPVQPDNPLLRMEQVILSPHIAYYSEQALQRVQTSAAEEVVRVLTGSPPRYWVNLWPDN